MKKTVFATVVTPQATGDEPEITISTIALDRDNDEVDPAGCDCSAYMRNPVVLFGHDYSSLPVGAATSIEVLPGTGIRARWRWLEGDEFATRVRNAFEQGVLRAASIGFRPTASEPNEFGGLRFTAWELLEYSLVPVPANPGAVRTLKRLKLWPADDTIEVIDDRPRTSYTRGFDGRTLDGIDVDPAMVREVVREVVPMEVRLAIRQMLAREIESAFSRLRGRVD